MLSVFMELNKNLLRYYIILYLTFSLQYIKDRIAPQKNV